MKNNNFDLYINNKLCNLHHYDHYNKNEYDIIDTELFDLFNTFKRILIYSSFDDVSKIKTATGYECDYIDTGNSERFDLYFNVLVNDKTFILHIVKE